MLFDIKESLDTLRQGSSKYIEILDEEEDEDIDETTIDTEDSNVAKKEPASEIKKRYRKNAKEHEKESNDTVKQALDLVMEVIKVLEGCDSNMGIQRSTEKDDGNDDMSNVYDASTKK